LRAAIESAGQPLAEPEPEITEINADEPADFEVDLETQHASEIAASPDLVGYEHVVPDPIHVEASAELEPEPALAEHRQEEPDHAEPDQAEPDQTEPAHAEPAPAEATELTAFVADLEASLGDSFPQAQPPAAELPAEHSPVAHSPLTEAPETRPLPGWPVGPAPLPAVARTPEPEPEPVTLEPVALESEIPAPPAALPAIAASGAATAAAPAMSYSPAAVRPLGAGAQAMHPSDSVDLAEMFGELKHELEEEVIAGDDDPETHYNLGVAFREMGLLDEAIAELQKVCTAIDRGKAFTQPVQTYTWLAQCFLDKGVPEAAIRWYEKALNIPGLDDEARVAINYELGSACETALDKPAALRHFTSVYGSNIDYRDVAERIQALKS
jgi:hypothetical protein